MKKIFFLHLITVILIGFSMIARCAQEPYRHFVRSVPITMINTDNAINLKVTIKEIKTDLIKAINTIYIKPVYMQLHPYIQLRVKRPSMRTFRVPLASLSVTIDDIAKKNLPSLGSFVLTKEELEQIKAINICNIAATIEYIDGSYRVAKFTRFNLFFNPESLI